MSHIAKLQQQFIEYLNANAFDQQPAGLYEPVNYIMGLGGKRLRPVLLLLSYQLFKEDVAKAMPHLSARG